MSSFANFRVKPLKTSHVGHIDVKVTTSHGFSKVFLVGEFSMNLHDCKETSAEDTLLEFFLVFALSGTKKTARKSSCHVLDESGFQNFLEQGS